MSFDFHLLTLFPRLLDSAFAPEAGLLGKAAASGVIRVLPHDLREFGTGSYNRLDDDPYGGGAGLLMRVDVWAAAISAVRTRAQDAHVVMLSPDGAPCTQAHVRRLAHKSPLVLCCPRYEGIDERVHALCDETLSVGDFILSGGDYAALALIDAVARLQPGMLGNAASLDDESFAHPGRLEHAQYTRPQEFNGAAVPPILLSGDHAKIARWRLGSQIARTLERRGDLLQRFPLTREEEEALAFYLRP